MMARRALVTGSAGFIGYHLCRRLLAEGWDVTGLDAMTPYYDLRLKERRHTMLAQNEAFRPVIGRVEDLGRMAGLVDALRPDAILHLAAQAGVRHSIDAPRDYVTANLQGTFEVLEAARAQVPGHLLIASTSSVYGANAAMPYAETDRADHQMSFYAATKKAGEGMAHSYAHLYGIPTTMFRFFTVYGPWGRPDMALFKFTRAILSGAPIEVYNHGEMQRDFTYVDDLIEGIVRLIGVVPGTGPVSEADSLSPVAPWRTVNIGNGAPVRLLDFVEAIEAALGQHATRRMMPMQPGDVVETHADISELERDLGYQPQTKVAQGVAEFTKWYSNFYR
jgi:UDP-glucuronate 4-epimerase